MADGYVATPADVNAARIAQANGNNATADPMMARDSDSASMVDYWDMIDAILGGAKTMRDAGEKFFPRFPDESSTEYQFRQKLTKFTNVFKDIVDDLASKPFNEEVSLLEDDDKAVPDELTEFCENVDGAGNNITMFAGQVFYGGFANCVDWIFVDYPKPDPTVRTIADVKAAGLRPTWSRVLGRNVLSVKGKMVGAKFTLVYMRIYEPGDTDHIRVFTRDDSGSVNWQLFEKRDAIDPVSKSRFYPIDGGNISIGVIPLVPFATGKRNGTRFVWEPMLKSAAELQVELYQSESGLKFAKTLTSYPMLAANGISPPMEADGKTPKRIAVGPNRVLYAPHNNSSGRIGSWEYLEPSATSLTFLASDNEKTITQLRELGRQPLTANSGNLTVITTAVAAGKSNSAVKQCAYLLKDSLENAFVITCLWLGITPDTYDPTVYVYTEFEDWADGNDVEALVQIRANKDISRETLWEELRRRSILSSEFNKDDEEKALSKEALDAIPSGMGVDTTLTPPADPANNLLPDPNPKV